MASWLLLHALLLVRFDQLRLLRAPCLFVMLKAACRWVAPAVQPLARVEVIVRP